MLMESHEYLPEADGSDAGDGTAAASIAIPLWMFLSSFRYIRSRSSTRTMYDLIIGVVTCVCVLQETIVFDTIDIG